MTHENVLHSSFSSFGKSWPDRLRATLRTVYIPLSFFAISVLITWTRFAHPYGVSLEDDMNGTFPMYSLLADSFRNGQIPLWNPYSFLGGPLIPLMQSVLYPGNILFCVLPAELAVPLFLCLHKVVAAGGTYLYLRRFGFSKTACFGGGIVLMLCGFFTGQSRHLGIVCASAWIPWLFLGWELLRYGPKKRGLIILAGALAMMVLAGRAETASRSALFLGIYAMFRPMGRRLATPVYLTAALILAGSLSMCVIAPVALGIRGTARETMSYAMFCEASMPPQALIELLAPHFYGSDLPGWYKSSYWGSVSPWETASYIGLTPLVMGIVTIIRHIRRDDLVRIWSIIAGLALLLALGQYTPLHPLIYRVPVLNLFRAAARFIVFFDLAFAVLFAVAMQELSRKNKKNKIPQWWKMTGWGFLGFAAILAAMIIISKNLHASFLSEPLARSLRGSAKQIEELFDCTSLETMLPLATAFICGVSLLVLAKLRRVKLMVANVLCLALVDLIVFGATFDGTSKLARARADDSLGIATASLELQADVRSARMLSMSPWTNYSRSLMLPNTNVPSRIRSLNGYFPLTPQNFEKLFGFTSTVSTPVASFLLYENRLLSTFGVKYLIGWNQHLGNAIHNWPWKSWAAKESTTTRHTDLSPSAVLGEAQWRNNCGTLQKNSSRVPVFIFTVPSDGFSAYRCHFRVRTKDVCDGHLRMLAVGGEAKRKVILGKHVIASNVITSQFQNYQFSFVNHGHSLVELHFYTHSLVPIELEGLVIEEVGVPDSGKLGDNAANFSESSPYEIVHFFRPTGTTEGIELPKLCVARNRNASPLVYLARRILPVKRFDAAVRILTDTSSDFRPGIDAIIEHPDDAATMRSEGGTAQIITDSLNSVEIDCLADGISLLVFLDSFDDGWSATVNGQPAKIYRTNGFTKGVFVPAGHSIVRFDYFPPGLHAGLAITALGLTGCVGIFLFPYIKRFLKRQS